MKFKGEPKRRLKANRSEEISLVLSTAMHSFFLLFSFFSFSLDSWLCLISIDFEIDQNVTVSATFFVPNTLYL